MRLILLCLMAWLVLVVAALASNGVPDKGGPHAPGRAIAH